MVGPTPQERIIDLYVALGCGILVLVIVATALVLAPAQVRRQMALPMAGFSCLMGALVAMATVRLIGIHAGVDTTDLALVIEFAGICIAGMIFIAMLVRRQRARGREEQR